MSSIEQYIQSIEIQLKQFEEKRLINEDYKKTLEEWSLLSVASATSGFFGGPTLEMDRYVSLNGQRTTANMDQEKIESNTIKCPEGGEITVEFAFESTLDLPIGFVDVHLYEYGIFGDTPLQNHVLGADGKTTFEGLTKGTKYLVIVHDPNTKANNEKMIKAYDQLQLDLHRTMSSSWSQYIHEWRRIDLAQESINAIGQGSLDAIKGFYDDVEFIYNIVAHPIDTTNKIKNGAEEFSEMMIAFADMLTDITGEQVADSLQSAKESTNEILAFFNDEAAMFIFLRAMSVTVSMYPFNRLLGLMAGLAGALVTDIIIGLLVSALLSLIATPAVGILYFIFRTGRRFSKYTKTIVKICHEVKLIMKLFQKHVKEFFGSIREINLKRSVHHRRLREGKTGEVAHTQRTEITKSDTQKHNQQSETPDNHKNQESNNTCKKDCPVSLVTGEELLQLDDAQLLGFKKFAFTRLYRTSGVEVESDFGYGWVHSFSHQITFTESEIIWRDHELLITQLPLPDERYIYGLNPLAKSGAFLGAEENHYILTSGSLDGWYLEVLREGNHGKIVRLFDSQGNSLYPHFTEDGRIALLENRISDEALRFKYDAINDDSSLMRLTEINLVRIHRNIEVNAPWQHISQIMRYEYHDNGQLKSAINAIGQKEDYEYREDHVFTLRRLAGGAEFYWEWEGEGKNVRAIRHTSNLPNFDVRFQWYDMGGVFVINADNSTEQYMHDEHTARLLSKTDPDGAITTYEYDGDGNRIKEIDGLGNETIFAYDSHQQLIGTIAPNGLRTEYDYDSQGNCTRKRVSSDDLSIFQSTYYEYDDKGHCIVETDPLENQTRYGWTDEGKLSKVIFADQSERTYRYDQRGLLTVETREDGAELRYQYDDQGFVIARTYLNKTTRYLRDGIGNITQVIHPNGTKEHYRYNEYNTITLHQDANNNRTRYEYDGVFHRIAREIKPDGSVLHYRYDNAKNFLSHIINEKGEVYEINYHPNGLVKEEITFDGRRFEYDYDKNGFLTEKREIGLNQTLEDALITTYQRDPLGKLLRKILPDQTIEYIYDDLGHLLSVDDGNHPLSYEYDALGRLTAEHQGYATTKYHYDAVGNLTEMILPDDNVIQYDYNAGHLQKVHLNGNELIHHHHQLGGIESQRQFGQMSMSLKYDDQFRLTEQIIQSEHNHQKTLASRHYRYDPAGNLAELNDSLLGKNRYQYNALNQLTEAVLEPTTQSSYALAEYFTHDKAGNVLGTDLTEKDLANIKIKGNQLLQQKDKYFGYDAYGNLTQVRKNETAFFDYEYDSLHRLIKLMNHETGEIVEYQYDAFGRRIQKSITPTTKDGRVLTAKEQKKQTKTTHFLWQGDRLLAEYEEEALLYPVGSPYGGEYRTYLYEHNNAFKPLAILQGKGKTTTPYFYLNDHLGTPKQLMNSDGKIVWSASFKAYGGILEQHENEIKQPLRFQGQYFDEESGLHYNRHRYYDPETARFITFDPIGLAGGLNNTQYVPNPTGWIDPLGLQTIKGSKPNGCGGSETPLPSITRHNPEDIRFSQTSVNGSDEIIESMRRDGWNGAPIDVVKMPDGKLTTIDNTRVASAREAGIDVQAVVRGYDDPLPADMIERFTTKKGIPSTWGEAISLRIQKQKASFRNNNPMGSYVLEMRK